MIGEVLRNVYLQCGLSTARAWAEDPVLEIPDYVADMARRAYVAARSLPEELWENDYVSMLAIWDHLPYRSLIYRRSSEFAYRLSVRGGCLLAHYVWSTQSVSIQMGPEGISAQLGAGVPVSVGVEGLGGHESLHVDIVSSFIQTGCELAGLGLLDRHVVVSTARTPTQKQIHTAQKKPWLTEIQPKILLLNPTEAIKLRDRPDAPGTHASPVPHTRRGNWATLRHPRFGAKVGTLVWRKPAWVGDREWVFQGRQYRVHIPDLEGAE